MKKILIIMISALILVSSVRGQSECVRLYGDVNQDGIIDVRDLMMLANTLAGNIQLSTVQFLAADVYQDGFLTVTDLSVEANYLAGNITTLPIKP